jgi:hypothetical protein
MKRRTPAAFIAEMIVRVPSEIGAPVAPRRNVGPRALITASAPSMAPATPVGSSSSPWIRVRFDWSY